MVFVNRLNPNSDRGETDAEEDSLACQGQKRKDRRVSAGCFQGRSVSLDDFEDIGDWEKLEEKGNRFAKKLFSFELCAYL